jgi:large subunit ribosomal protein L17
MFPMRHLMKGRKLGRTKSHRLATLKALSMALIEHEAITTTIPKAREASRYVDALITTARGGTLAARRLVASRLGNEAMAKKLFEDVAPRFATRPGAHRDEGKAQGRKEGKGREGQEGREEVGPLSLKRQIEGTITNPRRNGWGLVFLRSAAGCRRAGVWSPIRKAPDPFGPN